LDAAIPGAVVYYDDPSVVSGDVQWYGGVEVHELVLVAAVYGRMGEARVLGPIYREDTTPQGLEVLRGYLASFKVKRYLMETSGIYHIPAAWHFQEWFPDAQVVVMNSTDLSNYVRGTRKNDLVDATKLAQVASFDELIKPSYVPNRSQYILREMARYQHRLGWEVTRQKNRVKKVMAALGLPWDINLNSAAQCRCLVSFLQQSQAFGDFVRAWPGRLGKKVRDQIAPWGTVVLGEAGRQILLSLLRDLAVMAELEKLAEGRVETQAREHAEIEKSASALVEFPGLGYLESLGLLAEIGDVARFPSAGHLLVYAGIAPSGGTSGVSTLGATVETVVAQDVPNKKCNKRLKGTLTRIAVTILRDCVRTQRDDDLYLYARELRGENMAKKKRIFKVAAKVGRKLYHVLATGESYCGNAEKAGEATVAGGVLSRSAKQRQRYRKEREARILADRKVGTLVEKLRECGVEEETIRTILEVA